MASIFPFPFRFFVARVKILGATQSAIACEFMSARTFPFVSWIFPRV